MKTNFDAYKKELELLPCGIEFGVNKTTQIPYSCNRMNCGECLFNKAEYTVVNIDRNGLEQNIKNLLN